VEPENEALHFREAQRHLHHQSRRHRRQLDDATHFLADVARRGGKILFVGCKKQAQEAIKEAAIACGQFYVNQRWLGGTLTNLQTIRKSVGRLKYIEEIEKDPNYSKMGKQELAALAARARNSAATSKASATCRSCPTPSSSSTPPARPSPSPRPCACNIPTVAIVDTNADPSLVNYPIAGNDDAIRAIRILLQKLVDAIASGGGESARREEVEMAGVSE
jgi:small subunit ribosomal protein S2